MDMQRYHTRLRRLVILAAAGALCAGLLWPPVPEAAAGLPAPLPTQIPIRDIGEPPTPSLPAKPFVPAPTRKPRRHKPTRHRRPARPPEVRPRTATPPPVTSQPSAASPAKGQPGPKLEQRQEAPIESIMALDPLPAPALGTAGPKPAAAEFPPKPEPAPGPAPAKP